MQWKKEVMRRRSSEEAVPSAPNKYVCEGRVRSRKRQRKGRAEDESMPQEDLDDIDEYFAFLSRIFSKLKFNRNPSMSKSTPSYRKDSQ